MAHRIKDTDGICCPCAEREGCNCGAPCTMVECRTRGGVASLGGQAEFADPSVPPKKYRRIVGTGETRRCNYNGANCTSGIQGSDASVYYSGDIVYNALTLAVTDTSVQRTLQNFGSCPAVSVLSTSSYAYRVSEAPPSDANAFGFKMVQTPTTKTVSGLGVCFDPSGPGTSIATGSRTLTLSVEDTDADAITRLLAGSGGTWGAWTTVGDGLGATCVPTSCCKSTWEPRGAGEFSFAYQEAQYRVTSTGNTPGWSVTMRLRFYRKLWGAPVEAYALFAEETVVRTADLDGKVEATGDVPIEQGYDTYLQACARINT